jgi:hypothetical protein
MSMPGFTAEATLYETRNRYHTAADYQRNAQVVVYPAYYLDEQCYVRCRETCDCSDLQGWARGACSRACMRGCDRACTVW